MRVIIVFDSWFGNTKKVAEAIAKGMAGEVKLLNLHDSTKISFKNPDLLVVGSPTHGGQATPDIMEFLNSLKNLDGVKAATFDTRVPTKWVKLIGFAAGRIAKALKEKGASVLEPAGGFFVKGKQGPLLAGELKRAEKWAQQISQQVIAL